MVFFFSFSNGLWLKEVIFSDDDFQVSRKSIKKKPTESMENEVVEENNEKNVCIELVEDSDSDVFEQKPLSNTRKSRVKDGSSHTCKRKKAVQSRMPKKDSTPQTNSSSSTAKTKNTEQNGRL